jgi:hypothetical protein
MYKYYISMRSHITMMLIAILIKIWTTILSRPIKIPRNVSRGNDVVCLYLIQNVFLKIKSFQSFSYTILELSQNNLKHCITLP